MAARNICFRADETLYRDLKAQAHRDDASLGQTVRTLVRVGLGEPVRAAALREAKMDLLRDLRARLGRET